MAKKSFVTNVPDRLGVLVQTCRLVAEKGGNMSRISYNRAVDSCTLFLDVVGEEEALEAITEEFKKLGYLMENLPLETRVIMVDIKMPDTAGAMVPILELLKERGVFVSYVNTAATSEAYQHCRLGLLLENPNNIKRLLREMSMIYPIEIVDYDDSEQNLDNTIFYLRLANDVQKMFGLSQETTLDFIADANRILQMLEKRGEDPNKVFDYIRRFANFVKLYEGKNFNPRMSCIRLTPQVVLVTIEPPCGSNTYIFETKDRLYFIDSGFEVYQKEMLALLKEIFPDWDSRKKTMYITHADPDHYGLLSVIKDAEIIMNEKSKRNFEKNAKGLPDYRERQEICEGYIRMSRIITGNSVPDVKRIQVMDKDTPLEHDKLLKISELTIGDMNFEVYEGSGGHMYGEMVYLCREPAVIFTGDILVNISGFSKETAAFNSLAPYLMTTVNIDSKKASAMRRAVTALIQKVEKETGKTCLVCGGHGPLSRMEGSKIVTLEDAKELFYQYNM